ncbi:uncharacterized protein F4822DRAFT_184795 [Hypoxylon trugodes]|uniref:uncharacterized protein n=1 Tax=Hypoxylon trugodes TaxID=326681 RepID=UPI002197E7B7|nr:uncharacterized protein F4822DRAFT_184795 [Hypoxylon trugodes]KAI1391405.1 hypothetical protein F4822DRAFT_184795 [Hypoxylon trugodes]
MYGLKPFAALSSLLFSPATEHLKLNVTAVSARDGRSTIECWQLDQPFSWYPNGAFAASFHSLSSMTYTFVPRGYDTGSVNAPRKQWAIVIAGLLHISLPHDNTTSAYIPAGENGIVFAADTADISYTGHVSQFPGVTETVFLQFPTSDGGVPPHRELHMGPCKVHETSGLRGLSVDVSSSSLF